MRLNTIFKSVAKTVTNNSPTILTVMGVVGVATTATLTGRATIQAVRLLDDVKIKVAEVEEVDVDEVKLSKRVVAETVWTLYIPVVLSGATTIACIIGAHSIHARRNAALLTLYTLSDKAYSEYKDKTKELFGEKEAVKIKEAVAQDHVSDNPPNPNEVVVVGKGTMLCREPITGRYFESDYEEIRKSINDLNQLRITDSYVSLNDFYSLLGLETTEIGEELGWNQDRVIEIDPTSVLSTDGRPCLTFTFVNNPVPNYYKAY